MKKWFVILLTLALLAGLALSAPAPVVAAPREQALPRITTRDSGRAQAFIQLVNNWTAPEPSAESSQDLPQQTLTW